MLEYTLFLTKRAILQFLCNFIPFKATRKKARNAVFDKYLSDKIITLDKVDSHLPHAVLAQINAHNNKYFVAKNRQITATIGGGESDNRHTHNTQKTHFGYFDFDKNSFSPHSPLNPWAFIRVCNEAITLRACLESILPAIQRGIIAYNDCTDGSEEIILDFCAKYPTFIPAKYPHSVQIQNPQSEENKFATYCNFALSFIPKNEWLVNIDCDHIYDSKKLYKSFYLPKNKFDIMCIARIYGVLVKGRNVYIGNYPNIGALGDYFTNGSDHRLIYNDNLKFVVWYPDEDTKQLFYEVLTYENRRRHIYTELNNYHFSRIKISRAKANDSDIKTAFSLDEIRQSPLVGTRIDPKLLDKDKILAIYDNFDWDKANYKKP